VMSWLSAAAMQRDTSRSEKPGSVATTMTMWLRLAAIKLFAEGVRAPQQVAAWRQLLDDALAVAAAHDLDLVAAGVAAPLAARVALQAAGGGVDFVMAAEGGDDDALQACLGRLDGVGAFFHSNL